MISFIQGSRRPRLKPPSSLHLAAIPPADGRDLLSSLPREQIDDVLRRLPIGDAVRTSSLAKAWRNSWKMCPGLPLVFFSDDPPDAVNSVLDRYACNVEVFEVHFKSESRLMLDGWLHTLANKNVKSVELYFVPATLSEVALIPESLFTCRWITNLVLEFCMIPPLPSTFQGFPQLERLQLHEVKFPENGERTFEGLIAMSPSLKTLEIQFPTFQGHEHGHVYNEWEIQAPKVEDLDIRAFMEDYGWQIIDLPSIVTANIELEGPQIARILSGITRVQNLHVDFTDDTIVEHLPSYFVDLKCLSFRTIFIRFCTVMSIFCILRNAPNLEDLQIEILHEEDEDIEMDMEFFSSQPSVGLFPKLKSIQLLGIIGQSNEMRFIEFVLSKAARLNKFEVFVDDDSTKSIDEMSSELANYRKASPEADVVVGRFLGYHINDGEPDEELEEEPRTIDEGRGIDEEPQTDNKEPEC